MEGLKVRDGHADDAFFKGGVVMTDEHLRST
jgi:hypothetical protein